MDVSNATELYLEMVKVSNFMLYIYFVTVKKGKTKRICGPPEIILAFNCLLATSQLESLSSKFAFCLLFCKV